MRNNGHDGAHLVAMYVVHFRRDSFWAGYATLVQAPGPPQSWETSPGAHGVLHAISSADLNKIAGSENGYRKRMVSYVGTWNTPQRRLLRVMDSGS